MKKLGKTLRALILPLIAALVGGTAVAVVAGVLTLERAKGWLGLPRQLKSPIPLGLNTPATTPPAQLDDRGQIGADYVAMFLTDGKVYFGHIEKADSQNPVLTDVFYLQVQSIPADQSAPQAPEEDSQIRVEAPTSPTDFQLVKRGDELHGPTGRMELNRDHILMWQRLRPDSKVFKAIAAYYEQLPQ